MINNYYLLDKVFHLDSCNLQIQQVTVVSRFIYGQGSDISIEYVYNNNKYIDDVENFYYTKIEASRALSTILNSKIRSCEDYIEEYQNKLKDYKQKLENIWKD